ncbi:MAG TPA: CCA tRNA nucleotidyltransferase [Planctomycetaceae bacterium]|nr:CCA tRNA nucleotidyltransferase [Planctomycetaceae bacterium]HIQ22705.1 CCA tRNA nucleotidyltransferase [Planctomycetota bacterium]
MSAVDPAKQRQFAMDIVRRLRRAGFVAYWAGGCVRDELMGRVPTDYDVATDAVPDQIRGLFGWRRTLAVGAAFGVITILGPRGAGQVEVATFRRDESYSDGRRPDRVTFCSPEEDARRRDFTINGLFYDPLEDRVIDYVGGRRDIQRRLIRAIGDPVERFGEDKLRLLRAVRFAAAFDFTLEEETLAAIARMAPEIRVVSPERIAMELRKILEDPRRVRGVQLLRETGLAQAVLPEIVPQGATDQQQVQRNLAVLAHLDQAPFPLAMAALLQGLVEPYRVRPLGRRLRLANHEIGRIGWLLENRTALDAARSQPWSAVQRLLVAEGAEDLVRLTEARARAGQADPDEARWCREKLALPRHQLDPPPLLTGHDLIDLGIPPGPQLGQLLAQLRDAQLDGRIGTKQDALALARQLDRSAGKKS